MPSLLVAQVDGTSAATPAIAGMLSLINARRQAQGKVIGVCVCVTVSGSVSGSEWRRVHTVLHDHLILSLMSNEQKLVL